MPSPMTAPAATIVFSTYNGERTLSRMLEALCLVSPPRGGLEVIAVDNASVDNTPDILHSFLDRLPLSVLYQPKRGKNRALNLAIPHIRGELVVFTDDDVLPETNWLYRYQHYADTRPECDIFGGAILPYWERAPQRWILDSVPHGVTFALTAPDLVEGAIHPGLIWGPNMAVRKKIFDAGHRFDEDVGPSSGQYVMGSETEFNIRVAAKGHKTWFCPEARVRHIIRDFQMTQNWIVQRAYRFGRSGCLQEYGMLGKIPFEPFLVSSFPFPKWMLRRAVQDSVLGYLWKLVRNDEKSVKKLWDASFYRGYMSQAQILMKLHKASPQFPCIKQEKPRIESRLM